MTCSIAHIRTGEVVGLFVSALNRRTRSFLQSTTLFFLFISQKLCIYSKYGAKTLNAFWIQFHYIGAEKCDHIQ